MNFTAPLRKHPVFQDPRLFQITALGSFLIYGGIQLNWFEDAMRIIVILSMALLTQAAAVVFLNLRWDAMRSGLITGLGLTLLFHSSSPAMWAFAPVVAIASKFLIRVKGKHLFNPANFGLILPILLFGDGWVSPGQWGSGAMLAFFFSAAALMVLMRVGRIDTSLAFLITFFGLDALRSLVYLGWEWDWMFHKVSNGSILLFAFFMITDPRTTPNAPWARIVWAAAIGVSAFVLTNWFYLHTAPIWALFFSVPVMYIFDRMSKHRAFNWKQNITSQTV
jgi:Na+-transporting NADH:ubiquinone oxidoreductase subunit NqrB